LRKAVELMKYVTLKNMERATQQIAKKGYDWNTANDIAINCFAMAKSVGMSVEFFIQKVADLRVEGTVQ
jgi:uncharacterized protein (DUF2132 family)